MNKKIFLAPTSIKSMAAAHAKIYSDKKEYVLRISDCHNTIKLWGKTDNEEDLIEGIEKLENLTSLAAELKQVLEGKLKQLKRDINSIQIWASVEIMNNSEHLKAIAVKNKTDKETVFQWFRKNNPELLKHYNINLIAELLNIQPHEVWE
jgi:ABC-type transporter Mla subunit MlaD